MDTDLKKSHSVKSNFILLIMTIMACFSIPLIFIGSSLLFSYYQIAIPSLIIGMLIFVISSIAFINFKRWFYEKII